MEWYIESNDLSCSAMRGSLISFHFFDLINAVFIFSFSGTSLRHS